MMSATLKDGTRVHARGSVYMRPIVHVGPRPAGDLEDETTCVRAHRWTRYRVRSDGRTRETGRGVANAVEEKNTAKTREFGAHGAKQNVERFKELMAGKEAPDLIILDEASRFCKTAAQIRNDWAARWPSAARVIEEVCK